MLHFSTAMILILLGGIVVVSYLFSIISNYLKIPSVLLLLAAGIVVRAIADAQGWALPIPAEAVEFLGVIGTIMIVLEAGLDLKLDREKTRLISSAFFSAFFILILCMAAVSAVLYYWLHESVRSCIVYSIPLSIMSSSIVLPSLHHLTERKKEFLVYEASFSDILGILLFNYFTGVEIVSASAVGGFFLNILIAVIFSIIFSVLLCIILTKTVMNVKFFLVFALLIILYETGKLINLPSLITILVFGLLMKNWHLIRLPKVNRLFPANKVNEATHLLHSITAESSFLVRTFFFLIFGYSINLSAIAANVIAIGSVIVIILFLIRFLYLRFFIKESVYPEVFFIPRGLITIMLFYKIPASYHPEKLQGGILFFIVIVTGLIMMLGMMFYKKKEVEVVEDQVLK